MARLVREGLTDSDIAGTTVAPRVVLGGGEAHIPINSVATSIAVTPVMINLVCLDHGMSHARIRPIGKHKTRLATTPTVSHRLRLAWAGG